MADDLALLVYVAALPNFCLHDGEPLITEDRLDLFKRLAVTSAEATEHGWKIAGSGDFLVKRCPTCSQTYSAIRDRIPIQVSQIQCPRCGVPRSLYCTITKVTLADGAFSFEATLTCPSCKKRSAFRKVLDRLADILSIEIGLTGITLKAKGK
jgi:hypothetical protein